MVSLWQESKELLEMHRMFDLLPWTGTLIPQFCKTVKSPKFQEQLWGGGRAAVQEI